MLVTKEYNRTNAMVYARRWAFDRNPLYYNYTGIGGNCTNFTSQCIYAGCCTMNYTPVFGWYYLSPAERTASWTGVGYFYDFLVNNREVGPFGRETGPEEMEVGDVIQLGREAGGYYHSLLVVGRDGDDFLVAAQSDDAYDRPLSTYTYDYARYLHIDGVRLRIPDTEDCFPLLLDGIAILPHPASAPPLPPEPEEEEPPEESGTEETPPDENEAENGTEPPPDTEEEEEGNA